MVTKSPTWQRLLDEAGIPYEENADVPEYPLIVRRVRTQIWYDIVEKTYQVQLHKYHGVYIDFIKIQGFEHNQQNGTDSAWVLTVQNLDGVKAALHSIEKIFPEVRFREVTNEDIEELVDEFETEDLVLIHS